MPGEPEKGKLLSGALWVGVSFVTVTPYRGVVLSWMWTWFAVPLGAPGITWAHAVGLSILLNAFTMKMPDATHTPAVKGGEAVAAWLLIYSLLWLASWAAHMIMGATNAG